MSVLHQQVLSITTGRWRGHDVVLHSVSCLLFPVQFYHSKEGTVMYRGALVTASPHSETLSDVRTSVPTIRSVLIIRTQQRNATQRNAMQCSSNVSVCIHPPSRSNLSNCHSKPRSIHLIPNNRTLPTITRTLNTTTYSRLCPPIKFS